VERGQLDREGRLTGAVIEISGVNELGELARSARLAGGKLVPEMRRGFAKAGPPAKKHVQAAIAAKVPKAGGYAALLHRVVRVRVATDTGFTTAGVTIKTYADGEQQRRDLPAINKGRLRKKVYGNPRVWVTQRVPDGFWDDAMDETGDEAHQRVRDVLDETARTLRG
jgi:hypothetical protein